MVAAPVPSAVEKLFITHPPSPPAAIARIMRTAADPKLSAVDIAKAIAGQPAFVERIMRAIKSPFYAARVAPASVQHAASLLGIRALRNLALWFALRETLHASMFRPDDITRLGEDWLRRAVSARTLARAVKTVSPDDAFTLGLLQDLGTISLFRSKRSELEKLSAFLALLPEKRLEEEQARFGATHDQAGAVLGKLWELPRELAAAISHHHFAGEAAIAPDTKALAMIAHHADALAAVFTAEERQTALESAYAGLERDFQLDTAAADKVLEAIPVELGEASTALGMPVGTQRSHVEIVHEIERKRATAKSGLAERVEKIGLDRDELRERLRLAYLEIDRLATKLAGMVAPRELAGVLRAGLARAAESGAPLSHLRMFIDELDALTDLHGAAFRSEALLAVARAIRSVVRSEDPLARMRAGDLALVMEETDEEEARFFLERIREAVAAAEIATPGGPVKLSVTAGLASVSGESLARASSGDLDAAMQALETAAVEALRQAQRSVGP